MNSIRNAPTEKTLTFTIFRKQIGRYCMRQLPNFVFFTLILLIWGCSRPESNSVTADFGRIHTVTGPVPIDSLGLTLIHEHLFLDWSSAVEEDPGQWEPDSAFEAILPYLEQARAFGVETLLDCTPEYIGRNPELLRRLSEASGIRIITNTGYYGARDDAHIPAHAYEETPEELSRHWIAEFEKGIGDTGIKPGFIKIGVDGNDTLSPIDEKLVRAAALTHLATGLTIVAHTGPDAPARQEVGILEEMGVKPEAWVWTHAQNGSSDTHVDLARKGAWISLDGLGYVTPAEGDSTQLFRYVDWLVRLKEEGLLDRTLIAHDAGWYTHGEPGGGDYTPHEGIFTLLVPVLERNGFSDADIRQLLFRNPMEAFAIRLRNSGQ